MTLALIAAASRFAHAEDPLVFSTSEVESGTFLIETESAYRAAPALSTEVTIRVTGLIARTAVLQRFENRSDSAAHGLYVFPLPPGSAVDRMRLEIGGRSIEGKIMERAHAERVFAEAKSSGKRASLLQQERPNMFSTRVANLGAHETLLVRIEYQEVVRYDSGTMSLRFPLRVNPRHFRAGAESSTFASGAFATPAARRTLPRGTTESLSARIRVELDAGFPLGEVKSPSHGIRVTHGDPTTTIELDEVRPERDFEITWQARGGAAPLFASFAEDHGSDRYILLMVLPPRAPNGMERRLQAKDPVFLGVRRRTEATPRNRRSRPSRVAAGDRTARDAGNEPGALVEPDRCSRPSADSKPQLAREIIFVIDTSGSMAGPSLPQAKSAVEFAVSRLGPSDWFNIIEFNHQARSLWTSAREVNAKSRSEALRFIRALHPSGGTHMLSALRLALPSPGQESDILRQIIFITDGAVDNEEQLFRFIQTNLGERRLFTVGIGSAPNSWFMGQAAKFGRGTFTHINQLGEVQAKMATLFSKIESPVLRDLQIDWGLTGVQAWPERIPDLYLGEPLILTARVPATVERIELRGTSKTDHFVRTLPLGQTRAERGISKLWARKKIASLTDRISMGTPELEVRPEIVRVALDHGLVSTYTSLVAVEELPQTVAEGPKSPTDPAMASLPAGGTPAPALLTLALLLLLLSLALPARRRTRA